MVSIWQLPAADGLGQGTREGLAEGAVLMPVRGVPAASPTSVHAYGTFSLRLHWLFGRTGTVEAMLTTAPPAILAAVDGGRDPRRHQHHPVIHSAMRNVADATSTGCAASAPVAPIPVIPVARGTQPTRPPRCVLRPRCGCKEEGRRLAGPGLGGTVANAALAKTEGRSPPCHAALSTAAVGSGREWPTS